MNVQVKIEGITEDKFDTDRLQQEKKITFRTFWSVGSLLHRRSPSLVSSICSPRGNFLSSY